MIWERKLQGTSAGVLLIVSLICAAFSLETPAHAREAGRSGPIRLIIAAAAGGPNDLPARIASEILSPKLGQPVVVEYQPGSGRAFGARVAAHSKPDGYTLFVGNTWTSRCHSRCVKKRGLRSGRRFRADWENCGRLSGFGCEPCVALENSGRLRQVRQSKSR